MQQFAEFVVESGDLFVTETFRELKQFSPVHLGILEYVVLPSPSQHMLTVHRRFVLLTWKRLYGISTLVSVVEFLGPPVAPYVTLFRDCLLHCDRYCDNANAPVIIAVMAVTISKIVLVSDSFIRLLFGTALALVFTFLAVILMGKLFCLR